MLMEQHGRSRGKANNIKASSHFNQSFGISLVYCSRDESNGRCVQSSLSEGTTFYLVATLIDSS
jgi:hypothetical protein